MKRFRKALAVVMCVVMTLTAAPLNGFVGMELPDGSGIRKLVESVSAAFDSFSTKAQAATYSGTCGDNLTWTLDTSTGVLNITGTGAMTNYSSSSSVPWYSYRSKIKTINIASGVTTIGDGAFFDCCSLTSITVDSNNNYYSSDEYGVLFNKDKTALIKYPVGNTRASYKIPDSVTNIVDGAFSSCNIWTIKIPDSVTNIGEYAFYSCTSLRNIFFSGTEEQWKAISIGSHNESLLNVTIYYNCVSSIIGIEKSSDLPVNSGNTLTFTVTTSSTDITRLRLEDGGVVVNEWTYSNATVVDNGDGTLTWYDLTQIINTPGDNITLDFRAGTADGYEESTYKTPAFTCIESSDIVDSGVCGENLTWTLYDTGELKITGTGAMTNYSSSSSVPWDSYRSKIKTINIASGVITIGDYAFCYCTSLTSVTISNSVTTIGGSAFHNCTKLTDVAIGNSVTSIGDKAFCWCASLTSVTIPDSVTSIGDYAFEDCHSLTSVTIGNSVTTIGDSAFRYCDSLTSVTIGNSVTTIGEGAFADCTSLTSITIPDSVTTIGDYAFYYCTSLTSVTIGDGVTTIADNVFNTCDSLTSVTVDVNNKNYSSNDDGVLFNKDKTKLVQYPIGNTRISYTIPDSVTTIGDYAFRDCTNLTSVTIPDSVTTIGYAAFADCTSLTSVTIPDSVTAIGDYAFYNCDSLTSITIGNSVTRIGDFAFYNCDSLTSITIGNSVKTIGNYAFYNCNTLTDVYYSGSEEEWKSISIYTGNDSLTSANIHYNYMNDHTHIFISKVTAEATCTQNGEIQYLCECGFGYKEKVDKIEHKLTHHVVESTCTVNGKEYDTCSECKQTFNQVILPLIEHEFTHYVVDSTCTVKGKEYDVCSLCEKTYNTVVLPLAEHKLTHHVVDSTCTVKGKEYDACSECKQTFNQVTLPLIEHEFTHYVVDSTCTVKGKEYDVCSLCEKTYNTVVLPLAEHKLTHHVVDSTCTVKGKEYDTCSECKGTFNTVELLLKEHALEHIKVDSTCTKTGYEYDCCAVCKQQFDYMEIPLKEHECTQNTIDPTCTEQGYTVYDCVNCDYVKLDDFIDALGHDLSEWKKIIEPNCEESGSEYRKCSRCTYNEVNVLDALGHTWSDWVTEKESTVLEEGLSARICSACKKREEKAIDRVQVDIEANKNYGLARFTVVHAQTKEPIEGANIFISTENDGENTFVTDAEGKANIILPVGKVSFSVVAEGYLPRNLTYTIVSGKQDIPVIGVSEKPMVDAEITATEMTYEEIIEAGIDVDDPENNHIFKYAIELTFTPTLEIYTFEYYWNQSTNEDVTPSQGESGEDEGESGEDEGESGEDEPLYHSITGDSFSGRKGKGYPGTLSDGTSFTVFTTEKFLLIIYGEVKWLKEMFDVEMIVFNTSLTDTAENCIAELELPNGVSLATMKGTPQTSIHDFGTLSSGEQKSHHWYVRGDEPGTYDVTASLKGTLMPFEEDFEYSYVAPSPIKVYAENALYMNIIIPDACYSYDLFKNLELEDYDDRYPVRIEIENVSNKPVYNLQHKIEGLVQKKVTTHHMFVEGKYTQATTEEIFKSEWYGDDFVFAVQQLNPGEKLVVELETTIEFFSSLEKFISENKKTNKAVSVFSYASKLAGLADPTGITTALKIGSKIISMMDVRYCLRKCIVHTLEGSTATIPHGFTIKHVARPSIFMKLTNNFVYGALDWLYGLDDNVIDAVGMSEKDELTSKETLIKKYSEKSAYVSSGSDDTTVTAWIERGDLLYDLKGNMLDIWVGPELYEERFLNNFLIGNYNDELKKMIFDMVLNGEEIYLPITKEQHYERNKYNINIPETLQEAQNDPFWTLLPDSESACHQFTAPEGKKNYKFVSSDGSFEAVYSHDGKLITDSRDIGTYNYCPQSKSSAGHFFYDILPWVVWGNAPDDTVSREEKVAKSLIGSISGILSPQSLTENSDKLTKEDMEYFYSLTPVEPYANNYAEQIFVTQNAIASIESLERQILNSDDIDSSDCELLKTLANKKLTQYDDLTKLWIKNESESGENIEECQKIAEKFISELSSRSEQYFERVALLENNDSEKLSKLESPFTIEGTNENAVIENGVLSYPGEGDIIIKSNGSGRATLCIDIGDGEIIRIPIATVDEHTCDGEWTELIEPTEDYEGYMVKYCSVCNELLDIGFPEVGNPIVTEINVVESSCKKAYDIGENFDSQGLELIVTYSDGTTEKITEGYSIAPITFNKPGEEKVKISYKDISTYIEVLINYPISEVKLSIKNTELLEKSYFKLRLFNLPETINKSDIRWTSSDEKVATVDNGLVRAVSPGTAVITVSDKNGMFQNSCTVVVKGLPEHTIYWIIDGEPVKETLREELPITEPENPAKEGYTFIGWDKEVPDTMPAEDLTFTAQWKVNTYTVKWIVDGTAITDTFEYAKAITQPSNPEKVGYTFIGWTPSVPETMPADNLTFTAQFELLVKELKVKNPSTNTVKYGDTLILHADFGETVLPEGYTILWTVEGAGFNMTPAADGLTCNMTSVANGNATVKATLVDENGEAVLDAEGNETSDTKELKSNASFWQKIVSFFKNLFRVNRIISE